MPLQNTDSAELAKRKFAIRENTLEIAFLKQAISAKAIRASLVIAPKLPEFVSAPTPVMPEYRREPWHKRLGTINALPKCPADRVTSRGRPISGIDKVEFKIKRNEAEVARLKAELGL